MNTILSSTSLQTKSSLIVALDYTDTYQALAFIDCISPSQCILKIGQEIFIQGGQKLVCNLQQRGFRIFLDLKFHDIPNTVAKAVSNAAELGVWMVNVHASGGERMMVAARESLISFGIDAPALVAVTVPTSMNDKDLNMMGIIDNVSDYTIRLATLAKTCGLDGVVCSAWDAANLKKKCGNNFILISPGIRLNNNSSDDQRRVTTPLQAKQLGVDYIVIGRPITRSINPVASLAEILHQLQT